MSEALHAAVAQFNIFGVARFLQERIPPGSFSSREDAFGDALGLFPQLIASQTVGYTGDGRMSFAALGRNPETKQVLALAVMDRAIAPPHLHRGANGIGEITITLAGRLNERTPRRLRVNTWDDESLATGLVWGEETSHQPEADFWMGVYLQPGGSNLCDNLPLKQLVAAFKRDTHLEPDWTVDGWEDLKEDEGRRVLYLAAGMVPRPRELMAPAF